MALATAERALPLAGKRNFFAELKAAFLAGHHAKKGIDPGAPHVGTGSCGAAVRPRGGGEKLFSEIFETPSLSLSALPR